MIYYWDLDVGQGVCVGIDDKWHYVGDGEDDWSGRFSIMLDDYPEEFVKVETPFQLACFKASIIE